MVSLILFIGFLTAGVTHWQGRQDRPTVLVLSTLGQDLGDGKLNDHAPLNENQGPSAEVTP